MFKTSKQTAFCKDIFSHHGREQTHTQNDLFIRASFLQNRWVFQRYTHKLKKGSPVRFYYVLNSQTHIRKQNTFTSNGFPRFKLIMAHNYYANFNRNGISHFQITPDYKRNTYQIVQIEMNKKQTQTNQIEQDKNRHISIGNLKELIEIGTNHQ